MDGFWGFSVFFFGGGGPGWGGGRGALVCYGFYYRCFLVIRRPGAFLTLHGSLRFAMVRVRVAPVERAVCRVPCVPCCRWSWSRGHPVFRFAFNF